MNKELKKKKAEKLRNKKLVKQYYWLKPTPWFKKKKKWKYDYSYIDWFGWPDGWNKAFGMMYLKELGAEIKRIGQKDFQILQQKEKYGQARNYVSGTSHEVHNIIRKYEYLSENICWDCGKPDVPVIDDGWVHPICLKCFIKAEHHRDKYIMKYKDDYIPCTDDELKARYEKAIISESDKMADSYTVNHWDKDNNKITETVDISETVKAIRDYWERRRKRYEKWVHSRRHSS